MVTEMGDETFIIAAIMAMRHAKAVVYAGAMAALAFMTVRPKPYSSRTIAPLSLSHVRCARGLKPCRGQCALISEP